MNLVKVYPDRFISEFIALNQFPKEVVMSDPANKNDGVNESCPFQINKEFSDGRVSGLV